MQKILVALDRSPQAPFVFAHALKLAQREVTVSPSNGET